VGDHVTGTELLGTQGPSGVGWLPDIVLVRLACILVFAY